MLEGNFILSHTLRALGLYAATREQVLGSIVHAPNRAIRSHASVPLLLSPFLSLSLSHAHSPPTSLPCWENGLNSRKQIADKGPRGTMVLPVRRQNVITERGCLGSVQRTRPANDKKAGQKPTSTTTTQRTLGRGREIGSPPRGLVFAFASPPGSGLKYL